MRGALAILLLSLPALARGPGKHTQDYHQGANAATSAGGPLARYLTPSGSTVSTSGVTFTRSSAGAACTAADGTVTFPAPGVPCLAGGYHARPQIADLATNTAALDNASWTKSNATVTANAAVAPDGTTTADTVTSTSSGGYIQQAFTSTGGAFSCSGYAQALTGTQGYAVAAYDVTGAAALKTTSCTASTTWPLRCAASVASTTSGHSIACRLYPGGTSGTGSVYAWGIQPEWSAVPNDYCPSGATPATCAAEVATVPRPSAMSLTNGCARICVTPPWTGSNPGPVSFGLSANAGNTARLLYFPQSTTVAAYDGTNAPFVEGGFVSSTRSCFVTKWGGGSLSVTNTTTGTAGTASSFTAFPSFDSTIHIGANGTGGGEPIGAVLDSLVIGSSSSACDGLEAALYPSVSGDVPTLAYSGPDGDSPITDATLLPYNTSLVSLLGMVSRKVTKLSTDYLQNATNASDVPPPFAAEFTYTGQDLALRYRAATTSGPNFWVWVDGHPTTTSPVAPGAETVDHLYRLRVTFGSSATRRIRIYVSLADFGGLEVGPTDVVTNPAITYPRIAWMGDSWTDGTGAADRLQTMAQVGTRLLSGGLAVPFVAGQGGTGYANDGGGGNKAVFGDATRIADIAAALPETLFITGSINDRNADPATVQTAAESAFAALQTALPSTRIVVVGVQSVGGATFGSSEAVNDAMRSAAATAGLTFIDPFQNRWITGTGHQGATTGDGNADVLIYTDGVHPTTAGHEYYARRIVRALQEGVP